MSLTVERGPGALCVIQDGQVQASCEIVELGDELFFQKLLGTGNPGALRAILREGKRLGGTFTVEADSPIAMRLARVYVAMGAELVYLTFRWK